MSDPLAPTPSFRSASWPIAVALAWLAASALGAEQPAVPREVPPSPSTAPGVRIWADPRFSHWPPIVFAGEVRNLSFELPVRKAGTEGSIAWESGEPLPFVLPSGTDRISGLVPLPTTLRQHQATLRIGPDSWTLPMRIVDAREPWPIAGLRDGFPVDHAGLPVVLVDRRRDPGGDRKWQLLDEGVPRPDGRPLLLGDPLAALGGDSWTGLDAEMRPVADERYPHHAAMAAFALLPQPMPRTIVWSPGNQSLFGGAWSQEEERLLGALRSRCESVGARPLLILVLPPIPLNAELRDLARTRRELLTRSATFLGWTVVDVEAIAGPAEEANRIGDGAFTRYPVGAAQERIRAALSRVLAR